MNEFAPKVEKAKGLQDKPKGVVKERLVELELVRISILTLQVIITFQHTPKGLWLSVRFSNLLRSRRPTYQMIGWL